jgi:small subunit ribosomal protein S17
MTTETLDRNKRKTFEGTVISDKMNKTRTVRVGRQAPHKFYEKIIKKSSKFFVHDEENASRAGDLVEIASTRPLSKNKRWRLVRIIKSAPKAEVAK